MATITTTVVYENGVLRPLEELDLSEHHLYQAIIVAAQAEEQQTLFDILGFDPDDEQAIGKAIEKQRLALLAFVGSATTDADDDASVRHDEYLYG